ncbi:MAG: hypothetical protein QOJ89_56 [bacterium]
MARPRPPCDSRICTYASTRAARSPPRNSSGLKVRHAHSLTAAMGISRRRPSVLPVARAMTQQAPTDDEPDDGGDAAIVEDGDCIADAAEATADSEDSAEVGDDDVPALAQPAACCDVDDAEDLCAACAATAPAAAAGPLTRSGAGPRGHAGAGRRDRPRGAADASGRAGRRRRSRRDPARPLPRGVVDRRSRAATPTRGCWTASSASAASTRSPDPHGARGRSRTRRASRRRAKGLRRVGERREPPVAHSRARVRRGADRRGRAVREWPAPPPRGSRGPPRRSAHRDRVRPHPLPAPPMSDAWIYGEQGATRRRGCWPSWGSARTACRRTARCAHRMARAAPPRSRSCSPAGSSSRCAPSCARGSPPTTTSARSRARGAGARRAGRRHRRRGGHELLVEPFSSHKLQARIARARRAVNGIDHDVRVGSLEMNLATYQVAIGGRPVEFTYLEYELLKFPVTHPRCGRRRGVPVPAGRASPAAVGAAAARGGAPAAETSSSTSPRALRAVGRPHPQTRRSRPPCSPPRRASRSAWSSSCVAWPWIM